MDVQACGTLASRRFLIRMEFANQKALPARMPCVASRLECSCIASSDAPWQCYFASSCPELSTIQSPLFSRDRITCIPQAFLPCRIDQRRCMVAPCPMQQLGLPTDPDRHTCQRVHPFALRSSDSFFFMRTSPGIGVVPAFMISCSIDLLPTSKATVDPSTSAMTRLETWKWKLTCATYDPSVPCPLDHLEFQ